MARGRDDFSKAYRDKHGGKKAGSMRELAKPYFDKVERKAKADMRRFERDIGKALGVRPTKGKR